MGLNFRTSRAENGRRVVILDDDQGILRAKGELDM